MFISSFCIKVAVVSEVFVVVTFSPEIKYIFVNFHGIQVSNLIDKKEFPARRLVA